MRCKVYEVVRNKLHKECLWKISSDIDSFDLGVIHFILQFIGSGYSFGTSAYIQ